MSGDAPQKCRQEYEKRIKLAIGYIQEHLNDDLSLQGIAHKTSFSPFHFHRLFKGLMGESLNHFVRRKRLEAAASMLAHTSKSIPEIAEETRFPSFEDFQREFEAYYGSTPTQYRMGASSKYPDSGHKEDPLSREQILNHGIFPVPQNFSIRQEPERMIAYVLNEDGGNRSVQKAWEILLRETWKSGMNSDEREKVAVLYDDERLTGFNCCYYDACLTLKPGETVPEGLSVRNLPGGIYAVLPFNGSVRDIESTYDTLYGYWLPDSGYEPDNTFGLQVISPEAKDVTPLQTFDILIPVKPIEY